MRIGIVTPAPAGSRYGNRLTAVRWTSFISYRGRCKRFVRSDSRRSSHLASRIDGNVGILGEDFVSYFDVGDTKQLAQLLTRAETCPKYLAELKGSEEDLA